MIATCFPLRFVSRLVTFWGLAAAFVVCAASQKAKEDHQLVEDAARITAGKKAGDRRPTLWIVGDSTVRVGTAGQRGWGDEIGPYFDLSKANIVNRAIGGRSSRTFLTDGRWDDILGQIEKGDVVLVQFGHNDGGKINDDFRARGTLRGNGDETEEIDNLLTQKHEVVHSYGWYLRHYVTTAKARGAMVVVCSPVPRKIWRDGGRIGRANNDYGKWAREAAAQAGGLFVDLNEIIARGYEQLGEEKVNAFFADARTHTTLEGAQYNARAVVAGLNGLTPNPVALWLNPAGRAVAAFRK